MPRMNWLGTSEPSLDPRYRNSEPWLGLRGERIREIILNSDIDHRHANRLPSDSKL
jgi:hypothetical protein